jgi:tRNA1(Val) A37 N6-methylase TrmN6
MRPVLKTNNPVLLSFAQSLLNEAKIESVVFDENASVMDGSLGILPRRLMVADDDFIRGQMVLREGMEHRAPPAGTTKDTFLGGRLTIEQPVGGFRAGLDAVMLAAAVPAQAGATMLELGSGAGTASLCLAARIPDVSITGAEIESDLVRISNQNATTNRMGDRVVFVTVDALDLPQDMKHDYNHVMCNPPFHGDDGERSPDEARALATHDGGSLSGWLNVGLKRTATGGTFTVIARADRLSEIVTLLPQTGLRLFPLWPRAGQAAKRIIVQLRKGSGAPQELCAGLALHRDDGTYTDEADLVLRGAKGLEF